MPNPEPMDVDEHQGGMEASGSGVKGEEKGPNKFDLAWGLPLKAKDKGKGKKVPQPPQVRSFTRFRDARSCGTDSDWVWCRSRTPDRIFERLELVASSQVRLATSLDLSVHPRLITNAARLTGIKVLGCQHKSCVSFERNVKSPYFLRPTEQVRPFCRD